MAACCVAVWYRTRTQLHSISHGRRDGMRGRSGHSISHGRRDGMRGKDTRSAMDVGTACEAEGQKSRSAMDVGAACREGQKSRSAMDVGTAFDDFKAVEECFEKLKKEHHHPLHVFNSQSAQDYNRKRVNAKNPKPPVDCQKIRYTYYSVRCVHYGELRSSRGSGIRPNQRSFAKGCQAKVTLSYDR